MSIIYEPTGKAREYSPLAANIYMGCNHGCKYCYAPSINFKKREDYLEPHPRRNIVQEFEKDCKQHVNSSDQVQFCFMTDPYNKLESELRLTRECLKLALKYRIPISILTKSKTVLNDLDVIKKFNGNIKIGFTLTFDNDKDSKEWESEASLPKERIETLKVLNQNNIKTWASFEPVIIPEQSLNLMFQTLKYVDLYKVGKINNFQGLDKTIDWTDFLDKTVNILRTGKKPFYIKKDLREAAPSIKLYGNEVLQDEFNLVTTFTKDTSF
jgi:DNA repair photolyase